MSFSVDDTLPFNKFTQFHDGNSMKATPISLNTLVLRVHAKGGLLP